MAKPKTLRWEDAAIRVTPNEGWACARCRRWYGDGPSGERAARYCCSTDAPCECGGRRSKHYTVCQACRDKIAMERWEGMPETPWDGTTPLVVYGSDRYFFDVDELCDYLDDMELVFAEGEEDVEATTEEYRAAALSEVQLCFCKEVSPPTFELLALFDDPDEDAEIDAAGLAVERAVNEWLSNSRKMWTETNSRPTRESVLQAIGVG